MADTAINPRPSRSSASGPAPASWTASARSRRPAATWSKAVTLLRERGVAAAAKKAGRDAREGLVASYIHAGGRLGVLIEVNCETDFVARNEEFQKLVRDLAMQVAGMARSIPTIESIPAEVLASQEGASCSRTSPSPRSPSRIRRRSSRASSTSGTSRSCSTSSPSATRTRRSGNWSRMPSPRSARTSGSARFVRYQLGEEL